MYKSCRWFQMALWSEGVTHTDIQLQVFFSLHSIGCANHTGILQVKIPALSKKLRGISSSLSAFPFFSPSPLLSFWESRRHHIIFSCPCRRAGISHAITSSWTDPPLTNGLALCLLSPFKGLSQNTFIAPAIFCLTAGALKSSESVLFSPVNV